MQTERYIFSFVCCAFFYLRLYFVSIMLCMTCCILFAIISNEAINRQTLAKGKTTTHSNKKKLYQKIVSFDVQAT